MKAGWLIWLIGAACLLLAGCSASRYVPEGEYLLDQVKIEIEDSTKTLSGQDMMTYVRQRPNNRMLQIARLRLGIYNMSGTDSTKWWNKWIRRLGEAPVVYDKEAMESDSLQLLRAMRNAGFLGASVKVDSFPDSRHRKIKLKYQLNAGNPHIINSIAYEFPDDTLGRIIMADSMRMLVRPGQRLDRNQLESQRQYITERLRNRGYWAFNKEYISFNADTTTGSRLVDLTMTVHTPRRNNTSKVDVDTHHEYIVRNIIVVTDYDGVREGDMQNITGRDTVAYRDLDILYGKKKYLRPSVIYDNCFLRKGMLFRQHDVDNTYEAMGRLPILRLVQIRMVPVGKVGNTGFVDAYILMTPNRSQSISLEVEGTNSEGDLGVALGINYTHRNAGKGSEELNFKVRGAYQAITGNLEGFIHHRYMEYGVETSVTFPKFKAPLLRESFKRRIKASTELHISANYQERPEYTRIISTMGWSYKWIRRDARHRYILTPIDINYVYLPKSTNNFLDQIAPDNPLLRYSYEDHFIMRLGFNFYYSNKLRPSPFRIQRQKDIVTLRVQSETAGNLLFGISRAIHPHRDFQTNPYKVFGINFSQYVRADADFSYLHVFDRRNSLAFYAGVGIGVPYGNSRILPFEKRFYGGGANGVRGWAVRTLGPGRYPGNNSVSDFIYQCGDIRLNLSVEYRAKLFWVVEGGLFIDAGNIWTIHNYETQPYGMFKFNSFYKEIAAAYGAGIRLDFNYFLVRFDLGMKAYNPAINAEPWPLLHPRWGRDRAFHFSIGYPF